MHHLVMSKSKCSLAFVLAAALTVPLQAQRVPQAIAPVACAEADSIIGPSTRQQKAQRLFGGYSRKDDRSSVRTRSMRPGGQGIETAIHWKGQPDATTPITFMDVFVPTEVAHRLGRTDTIALIVDDTLTILLGPSLDYTWSSPWLPSRIPVFIALRAERLAILAQASKAAVMVGGLRVAATEQELASMNALYRVVLCKPRLREV